jgi:branched-subunit amino acid aminotransferase/4-amino-4-deoxychorismate lyase
MNICTGVISDFLSKWFADLCTMGPEWQIRIAAMEQGFQCDAKPFTPRPRELLGRIWNHQRKLPELKTLDYQALADRQKEDGPDVESLLCNDKGAITEGVRTNLVYGINGRVFVPKSDCLFGLGIQRVLPLLNRHCTPCNESLLLSHLPKVEEILAINDLQGVCWLSEISEVGWKARSTRLIEILRAELPQNLRWW